MITIKEGTVITVTYHSENKDEVTIREVIVTSIPSKVIKTIDITHLQEPEKRDLKELYTKYREFYNNAIAQIPNFETWATTVLQRKITPKWRALKPDRVLSHSE